MNCATSQMGGRNCPWLRAAPVLTHTQRQTRWVHNSSPCSRINCMGRYASTPANRCTSPSSSLPSIECGRTPLRECGPRPRLRRGRRAGRIGWRWCIRWRRSLLSWRHVGRRRWWRIRGWCLRGRRCRLLISRRHGVFLLPAAGRPDQNRGRTQCNECSHDGVLFRWCFEALNQSSLPKELPVRQSSGVGRCNPLIR